MTDKVLKPYKTPVSSVFNLRAGAVHSREDVLILAGLGRLDEEHTAHTIILKWSGTLPWRGITVNWSAGSCCATSVSRQRFYLLGINGEFWLLHDNDLSEKQVGEDSLRAMAVIGRYIYAVGVAGRILRSEDGQSWERLVHAEVANNHLLEGIAAYASDEIYAVGAEGAIVLLRPAKAERVDSPTNLVLSAVCRGPDDVLYACGQRGTISRGRGHEWALIEHSVTNEDLWDIQTFQGRIFLTSTNFLYELKSGTLETVCFKHDIAFTFHKLASAGDGALLSVGQKDAFLFDGSQWIRLI